MPWQRRGSISGCFYGRRRIGQLPGMTRRFEMIPTMAESQNVSRMFTLAILAFDIPFLLYTGKKYPWIPLMMIFALAPFQHDLSDRRPRPVSPL